MEECFMKKIEISEDELEMMNYNDVAHVILEAQGKKMKLVDLFKEVGTVLGLEEEEYQSHIADFFELLSTDKRFIMLEDGFWDLKIKHNKGMETFEDEDDDDEIVLEEDADVETDDGFDDGVKDSDDDVDDDDLSDLVIVDDIEDEANL